MLVGHVVTILCKKPATLKADSVIVASFCLSQSPLLLEVRCSGQVLSETSLLLSGWALRSAFLVPVWATQASESCGIARLALTQENSALLLLCTLLLSQRMTLPRH